jgi:hypothetical protein
VKGVRRVCEEVESVLQSSLRPLRRKETRWGGREGREEGIVERGRPVVEALARESLGRTLRVELGQLIPKVK